MPSTVSPGSNGPWSDSRGWEDSATSGRLAGVGDAPRLATCSEGRDHVAGMTRRSLAPEPEGAPPVETGVARPGRSDSATEAEDS